MPAPVTSETAAVERQKDLCMPARPAKTPATMIHLTINPGRVITQRRQPFAKSTQHGGPEPLRVRRLAAPRGCASGIRSLEAGTSVLTGCGCWLHRDDFTGRFIITGTSVSDGTAMAGIGWEAAITAIGAGQLSCGSGGERRGLRLAASIAGGSRSASTTPFPASITAPAQS